MNSLILIIKGFIVGIGKVIPGISGAFFAIILNIYEPILNIISNFKKNFFINIKFLCLVSIGFVFAIAFGSKFVLYFLNNYYLETMFIIIGTMMGGIFPITKKIKNLKLRDIAVSIIIVLPFSLLSIIKIEHQLGISELHLLYFLSGILDAFASIVPGVSGTMLLMLMGTYSSILSSFSTVLNVSNIYTNIVVLLPFFLGFLIGTYSISKFMVFVLKKYKNISSICIVNFTITSILTILFNLKISNFCLTNVGGLLILLIISFLITRKLNK